MDDSDPAMPTQDEEINDQSETMLVEDTNLSTTFMAESAVDSKAELAAEIHTVIEKTRESDEKPPFSAGDLIVMGAVCSFEAAVTSKTILRWIVSVFSYYREAALDGCLASMDCAQQYRLPVIIGFGDGFND